MMINLIIRISGSNWGESDAGGAGLSIGGRSRILSNLLRQLIVPEFPTQTDDLMRDYITSE